MTTYRRTPPPTSSPWGRPDYTKEIAPGIWTVSTPGHGGIKCSPERNAQIAPCHRLADGWYEEDCDWAFVAITFPAEFSDHYRRTWGETYTKDPGDPVEWAWVTLIGMAKSEEQERDSARLLQAGEALRSAHDGQGTDDAGPHAGRKWIDAIFETAAGGRHACVARMDLEVYDALELFDPARNTYRHARETAIRLGLRCETLRPYRAKENAR